MTPSADNPNNCAACGHKARPDGGWCYMFRDAPTVVCLKHTARASMTVAEVIEDLYCMKRRREAWQSTPTR